MFGRGRHCATTSRLSTYSFPLVFTYTSILTLSLIRKPDTPHLLVLSLISSRAVRTRFIPSFLLLIVTQLRLRHLISSSLDLKLADPICAHERRCPNRPPHPPSLSLPHIIAITAPFPDHLRYITSAPTSSDTKHGRSRQSRLRAATLSVS